MSKSHKKIAILIGDNVHNYSHWLSMFQYLRQLSSHSIHYIVWNSEIADTARAIVDIDSVHLLSHTMFYLNDYKEVRKLLQQYMIDTTIEIGTIPKIIQWNIKNHTSLQKIITLHYQIKNPIIGYDTTIAPSNTPKIYHQDNMAYIPYPQVNYQEFLELDTQKVLNIKQELGLVHYREHIIYREFVVGYITTQSEYISDYLDKLQLMWYNIQTGQGNFTIPYEVQSTIPVLYELLDCIVIHSEYTEELDEYIISAMASGTILVVPRTQEYQSLLGKGALYYQQDSMNELFACIDILRKSEAKKKEIRQYASEQFQRKYSYQSIAQIWNKVITKI